MCVFVDPTPPVNWLLTTSHSHVEDSDLPLLRRTSHSNSAEDLELPSSAADVTAGNGIYNGKRNDNRPRSHRHFTNSAVNKEGAVIFTTDP